MNTFTLIRFSMSGSFTQKDVALSFALATITALLVIATTRWLHRYMGVYQNVLYRRYQYVPLKPSHPEFRLCQLEPGNIGDPIRIKLSHYSFGEHKHPAYDALSYVWGNPKVRQPVFINGQLSSLATNLHEALQSIRNRNSPITLWIDAICINQGDLKERSRQVQMMKVIFAGARSVIAWIGPALDNSDKAMEYIEQIARSPAPLSALQAASKQLELIQKSIQALFRRHYWERVWIVQEQASARQCQVRCGSVCIELHAFHVFVETLNSSFDVRNYMSVAKATRLLKVVKMCREQTPHKQRLIDLLWSTVDFQASDPRDKVYAIINIAQERDKLAIVPDYTRKNTLTILLRKLVRHHIMTEKNFDILCHFPTFGYEESNHRCSWVPNLYRHLNGLCPQSFRASGARIPGVEFSTSLELLTAKGLSLGTIATVIGPFGLGLSTGSSTDNSMLCNRSDDRLFNDLRVAARNALRTQHPGASEQRLDNILWNHIVGDNIELGKDSATVPCPCGYLELSEALSSSANSAELAEAYGQIISNHDELDTKKQSRANQDGINILDFCPYSHLSAFLRLSHRSFFVTIGGMVGLGPPNLKKGDLVSVVFGCSLPVVLRKMGRYHEWIGPAYVYEAMNGELVDGLSDNSPEIRDFILR